MYLDFADELRLPLRREDYPRTNPPPPDPDALISGSEAQSRVRGYLRQLAPHDLAVVRAETAALATGLSADRVRRSGAWRRLVAERTAGAPWWDALSGVEPGHRHRWRAGESLADWLRRVAGKRERRCPSRYEGVRRAKGDNAWNARYWLGGRWAPLHLNLGLFTGGVHGEDAEWAAGQCWRAFDRRWEPDNRPAGWRKPDPWDVVEELQGRWPRFGSAPPTVLPPCVEPLPGGGYEVRRRKLGVVATGIGTVREAWAVVKDHLGLPLGRKPVLLVS